MKKLLVMMLCVLLCGCINIAYANSMLFSADDLIGRLQWYQEGVTTSMVSSHGTEGTNNDGWGESHFLDTLPNGERVMLNVEGPGALLRIWLAGAWNMRKSTLHLYIDNAPTPTYDIPLESALVYNDPPFIFPAVADNSRSSGGNYLYIYVPFQHSLLVTATAVGKDFFYQLGYENYPDNTIVPETQPDMGCPEIAQSLSGVREQNWQGLASDEISLEMSPQSEFTLPSIAGPGVIRRLVIRVRDNAFEYRVAPHINDLIVKIAWDGESEPSICAPLGALFSVGELQSRTSQGTMAGFDRDSGYYLNFPMPFKESATITIVNQSNQETYPVQVFWWLESTSIEGMGVFKTKYTDQYISADDPNDFTIFEDDGTGRIVGIVQTLSGDKERRYLEGNEKIYWGENSIPGWYGTGVEDLYNGGGYFVYGPFTLPTHGNTAHTLTETDSTSMYRFFLTDAMFYNDGIHMTMEHGGSLNWDNPDDTVTNYIAMHARSLIYYYSFRK